MAEAPKYRLKREFASQKIATSEGLLIDVDFNHRYQHQGANELIEGSREVAQYFETRSPNPVSADVVNSFAEEKAEVEIEEQVEKKPKKPAKGKGPVMPKNQK